MNKVTCLICKGPMPDDIRENPFYPFCSKRCRTIDLGRWLSDEYKIPAGPSEDLSSPGREGEEVR